MSLRGMLGFEPVSLQVHQLTLCLLHVATVGAACFKVYKLISELMYVLPLMQQNPV